MPEGPRPAPPTRSARIVVKGEFNDARWANVFWAFLTGSGEITATNVAVLAQDVADIWSNQFLPLLSEDILVSSTTATLWGPDEVISADADVFANGNQTGAIVPAQVAICLSWDIAPSYRGGHPRTYIPLSLLEFVNGPTTLTNTCVADFQSAAEQFHTDIEEIDNLGAGVSSVEHGVMSFVRFGEWRDPPVFYRIRGVSIDNRIDTQRRRLGRDR